MLIFSQQNWNVYKICLLYQSVSPLKKAKREARNSAARLNGAEKLRFFRETTDRMV